MLQSDCFFVDKSRAFLLNGLLGHDLLTLMLSITDFSCSENPSHLYLPTKHTHLFIQVLIHSLKAYYYKLLNAMLYCLGRVYGAPNDPVCTLFQVFNIFLNSGPRFIKSRMILRWIDEDLQLQMAIAYHPKVQIQLERSKFFL